MLHCFMAQRPSSVDKAIKDANKARQSPFARLLPKITELFGVSRATAVFGVAFLAVLIIFAIFWFFHLAPPRTLVITSGTEGSSFQTFAERYRKTLWSNG